MGTRLGFASTLLTLLTQTITYAVDFNLDIQLGCCKGVLWFYRLFQSFLWDSSKGFILYARSTKAFTVLA